MHDIVITGGTIVDGTGTEPYTGDVAIDGDRIVAVGTVDEGAKRTIDAAGAIVTPGFVDIHAHYDGQATWDTLMAPSSWHGVTTVIMGNCGVGFAPCRPADHDRLIELMEGVEDIPGAALHEGLDWQWESFPQYLDALDRRHRDIDVGAQLPHGAVRLFVMGERGAKREDATAEDIVAMGRIAAEAMEAGAIGFATSRTRNHRSSNGELTPTLTATADELAGIATRDERQGRAPGGQRLLRHRRRDGHDPGDGRGVRPAAVDLHRPEQPHAGLVPRAARQDQRRQRPRPAGERPGRRPGDRHPARPPGDDEPAQRLAHRPPAGGQAVRRAPRRVPRPGGAGDDHRRARHAREPLVVGPHVPARRSARLRAGAGQERRRARAPRPAPRRRRSSTTI